MDILRFITAGNVDDGKSTLIGRLLYDTHNIKEDVLESVADGTQEAATINLAFITDGLRAERQQGITIDVAYKYFTTRHRKFIITDAPGHFEFTRNLVTGASAADVIIILIDAMNGITSQTKRHSLVASFLGMKHVVVAINKMDLLNYDEQIFTALKEEYLHIADGLGLTNPIFIPISALRGDNVSVPSAKMDWYHGETLLQYLAHCAPVHVQPDVARYTVQYVVTADGNGYAGKMLSGILKTGDVVTLYPGGQRATVASMIQGYEEVAEVVAGQNACIYLDRDAVAGRGTTIAGVANPPVSGTQFEAMVCWLNADAALQTGVAYVLRINEMEAACTITSVVYKIDVNSFEQYNDDKPVEVNQFARVTIQTDDVVVYDAYNKLPATGRGIIIDAGTNYTSGAFVI